jgi:hypothetical protein
MYGLPVQKNYVPFDVLPGIIGDFAFKDQIKLTADVFVLQKGV